MFTFTYITLQVFPRRTEYKSYTIVISCVLYSLWTPNAVSFPVSSVAFTLPCVQAFSWLMDAQEIYGCKMIL